MVALLPLERTVAYIPKLANLQAATAEVNLSLATSHVGAGMRVVSQAHPLFPTEEAM